MDSSASGTSTDSWLFIAKNIADDEDITAGKSPENNSKATEEMEDSDGISVISESEMYKNHSSDIELEKTPIPEEIEQEESTETQDDAKNKTDDENDEDSNDEQAMHMDVIERYEEKALKDFHASEPPAFQKNSSVLLLIGVSLIIAILYTNVSSLKSELARTVNLYEQRILRLEEENQLLRTQLDELISKLKNTHDIDILQKKTDRKSSKFQGHEKDVRPPITRKVWLGGEKEEVVNVLDKKYNSLPDYCYFTDEDDLFYEYNMENCEKKKQKMEERLKKSSGHEKRDTKYHQKENEFAADKDTGSDKYNVDDIWKSNDKNLNDFISKTADEILRSLNDDIQEIKNNRNPQNNKIDDKLQQDKKTFTKEKHRTNPQKNDSNSNEGDKKWKDNRKREGNVDDDKSYNKKQKPEKRQIKRKDNKDGSSGDWTDQRSKAREDARMKKDSGENWFLKRKNERELHRLETLKTE